MEKGQIKGKYMKVGDEVVGKHKWNYILGRIGNVIRIVNEEKVIVKWHTEPTGDSINPNIEQEVPIKRLRAQQYDTGTDTTSNT